VANLFILALIIHGYFGLFTWSLESDNLWNYMLQQLNIRPLVSILEWDLKKWAFPCAAFATVALLFIRIFSLPIIQRKSYETFLVSHFLLSIPMLLMAKVHSKSSLGLTFTSLVLYCADLAYRYLSSRKQQYAKFTKEPGNVVRIELLGTVEKFDSNSRSGLFFDIRVKKISYFSHPLK
jgi:hypothetical protein